MAVRAGSAAGLVLLATVVLAFVAAASARSGRYSNEEETYYIHFLENKAVQVFEPSRNDENVIAKGFGKGRVFDYPLTEEPDRQAELVGHARGLYYRTSNENDLEVFQEEITLMCYKGKEEYTGDSISIGGIWVSGYPKEFFILGGTGKYRGAEGYVKFQKYEEHVYEIKFHLEEQQNHMRHRLRA